MSDKNTILEQHISGEYKYGFTSDIDTEIAPKGVNEDIVRFISAKKNEPQWMLDLRLKAFRYWKTMEEPRHWAHLAYPGIDFQNIIYYAAPRPNKELKSL